MRVTGVGQWIAVTMLLAVFSTATAQLVGPAGIPGGPSEEYPRAAIYLEDSPAAQEMVEEAARLRRDKRIPDAVGVYQQIIDRYPQKLMTRGEGRYFDTVRWVQQELGSEPQLAATYRRMYEATAQRELAQALDAPNEAKALELVVHRYLLCAGGLEAGLQLAGLYLSIGNIVDAGAVLGEISDHPDLAQHAARFHFLQASVGLFSQDRQRFETHRQALEQLSERQYLAQLDAWASNLRPPGALSQSNDVAEAPAADIFAQLGKPLWVLAVPAMSGDRLDVEASVRFGRSEISPSGPRQSYLMVPAIDGSTLYINTAREILALDRISRRTMWQYDWVGAPGAENLVQGLQRSGLVTSDMRSVLVMEGRVYGVLGVASDMMGMWQREGLSTTLVCLEARDGSMKWQVQPGDVDPSLERGFFHGTPLAGPGRVYALVRRSQAGFCESFMVALDAQTGALLWRRHLSSTSAAIRNDQVPFAQMAVHGGRLFAVDHMGTVSCVDGRTGAMQWLAIISDQRMTTDAAIARATHVRASGFDTPPLIVDAGLIVNSYSDTNAVLLDPDTGRKVRDLAEPAFARASYLLPCGADVLAVGRSVHLLDGKTLEPRWSHTLDVASANAAMGLPSVTQSRVWIAVADHLSVLDLADGRELLNARIDEVGNAVAVGPQLLIAGAATIYSYMAWDVAHQRLLQQIAQGPGDPHPGLALAELALATDHGQSVLEGVDHALAAVRRRAADHPETLTTDPMQALVFSQVRSMIEPSRAPDPALREKLFERLAAATAGPGDEVVYLLALAQFMAQTDRAEQAVDYYQTIIKSPQLAGQPHQEGMVTQQAGQAARQRMERIVARAPGAYAKFEAQASQQLAQLMVGPHLDIEALIELARAYPLAHAASSALLAAAENYLRTGDPSRALPLLRRAYLHVRSQLAAEQVVGRLIQVLEEMGEPRQAAQWLGKAMRDYPQLRPMREGLACDANAWLTQLTEQQHAGGDALAALKLPLQKPLVLPGKVLLPTHQDRDRWPRDAVITQQDNKIQFRSGGDLAVRWERPAPQDQVQVLALTDDRVLLWYRSESRLVALDCQSGAEVWPAVQVAAVLGEIAVKEPAAARAQPLVRQGELRLLNGDIVIEGQMPAPFDGPMPGVPGFEGELRRQIAARSLIAVNDTVVCVSDLMGRVAGIDRLTGQVLWSTRCPFDALSFLEINDDAVALAGPTGVAGQEVRGSVVVLDALSGEMRHAAIELPQPANWLGLSPSGLVVTSAGGELVCYDMTRGSVMWRLPVNGVIEKGSIDAERIVLADGGRSILILEAATGERLGIMAASDVGPDNPPNWRRADEVYHLLTSEQAMAVTLSGQVMWRDAIYDDPKNLQVQLLSENYLVLIARDVVPAIAMLQVEGRPPRFEVPAARGQTYRVYLLDRNHGTILRQQQLGPLADPIDPGACALLNNRLILGAAASTVVIPGTEQ